MHGLFQNALDMNLDIRYSFIGTKIAFFNRIGSKFVYKVESIPSLQANP